MNRDTTKQDTRYAVRRGGLMAGLVAVSALAGSILPADARLPINGLTVAVSAKGDQLVVGGDNRTLYVLDPETLAVKTRVYLGAAIVGLGFNADGKLLVVSGDDGALYFIETKSWKTVKKLLNRHSATVSTAAGLVASADKDYRAKAVTVSAIDDARDIQTFKLETEMKVAALGISPDGGRLAVMLGENDDKEEPKVNYSDIPKDLKGLAKTEFQKKNDGKTSLVQIYDLKTGQKILEKKTYFTMNSSQAVAVFVKDGVLFNEYSNVGFMMANSGEGRLVQFPGSYLYGSGVSHDGGKVMTGNLREFALLDVGPLKAETGPPEILSGLTGSINSLSGFPEYFKGFDAPAGAKVVYGTTSAYRVVKIDAAGKVLKTEPVY
jgi:WD40 repeat protein